jgi:amidase
MPSGCACVGNGVNSFESGTWCFAHQCRALRFPHDHTPEHKDRRIAIDGQSYAYLDQIVWPGLATLPGPPATAAPIALAPTGLPIGVQIIGPYLEDRTTLRFAELIERAFGGFVAPVGLAS